MKKKEPKKPIVLYNHFLECSKSKCGFKFNIEHKSPNNNEIGLDKLKCPKCQSPMQLDKAMLDASGQPSKKARGHANAQATLMALKLAGEQKIQDAKEGKTNEMVTVRGTKPGEVATVPKKVVDDIEKIIAPELQK